MSINNLIISNDESLISNKDTNAKIAEWIKIGNSKKFHIFKYHWSDKKKIKKDIRYIKKIYNYFLLKFRIELNKHYGFKFSKRSWEIVIGYWLNLCICFYFDRWEQCRTLKKNKLKVKFFKFNKKNFIPQDTINFSIRSSNNDWNHWVFYEILKYKKFKLHKVKNKKPKLDLIFFPKKTNKLFSIFNYCFKNIIFKKKICMFDVDLPRFFKVKIDICFDKFSTIYQLKNFSKQDIKFKERISFFKNFRGFDKFSDFLITQFVYNFPKNFFEDYKFILSSLNESILPKKPKIIITSSSHIMNDPFKIYLACKVEAKSKLFVFQHGGSYHTQDLKLTDLIEYRNSDKFLTWGWKEKKNKNLIRMFNPKTIKSLPTLKGTKGILIPINSNFPTYPGYIHGLPRVEGDTKKYFKNIENFICNITPELQKITSIKMSNVRENKNIENFNFDQFKKNLKNKITFFRSLHTTKSHLNNFKLAVEFSNTTGFLELISLNYPTIIIFDNRIEKITKKTFYLYKLLKEANVLFTNPKDASNFINKNYDNIENWWSSKKVQKNIAIFKKNLSNVEKNPYKKFKSFLKKYV